MKLAAAVYSFQNSARQWFTGYLYRIRHHSKKTSGAIVKPNRVLVVMIGLIGDTVMSTPVVIEARRLWPEAHICVLVNGAGYELFVACPLVDSVKKTSVTPFSIRHRQEVRSLSNWIKDQQFEVAIISLGDQFAALLAEVGVPTRIGVAKHPLAPCLTDTYEIGSARDWGPQERLNALRGLDKNVRDVAPRLWVTNDARRSAASVLSALGVRSDDPYVVVHPFGSSRHQWWPLDRVRDIAAEIWNRYRLTTIIVGGPELSGVFQFSSGKSVDATGRLTLQELLAVIENARIVVTTDSGPFHISGALGRPTIGLFRTQRPEHAYRYPSATVVFGKLAACANQCKWDKCRHIPCDDLKEIHVDSVVRILDSLVQFV